VGAVLHRAAVLTAPATAAFARYFMIESLNGATEESLPEWYRSWEQTGLILWLDDGDGVVRYSAGDDNEIFRNGG
jgi:cation/acetate symporter